MKKLVCLLGGYYPYLTPNSKIANNILLELKNKYEITVIAQKTHFGSAKNDAIDGMKVLWVSDPHLMFHNYFSEKIRKARSPIGRFWGKTGLKSTQAINYMFRLLRKQSISKTYVNKLIRQLKKLNHKNGIDILMPVSAPHENVIACLRYREKEKSCLLFPYLLDRFAIGNSLYENQYIRRKRYPRHIQTEEKTLIVSDAVFALPPIATYYKNEMFAGINQKIIETEHPLLKEITYDHIESNNEHAGITLTYAGSLDIKLRNPETVLKIYKKACDICSDFTFNIYSFGNCNKILDSFKSQLGDSLNLCGCIPSNQVSEKLETSEILITVGNNSNEEVPSKLFEYLSYGKPIVHFYFNDNDAYLNYLGQYDCALCLKLDNALIDENAEKFIDFCKNKNNTKISFDKIANQYSHCTPSYVAKLFSQEFEKSGKHSHSVIVAHPNQQHSFRLAKALKNASYLHSLITTSFYTEKELRFVSKIIKHSLQKKFSRKADKELDGYVVKKCQVLGLIYYICLRVAQAFSCKIYPILCKKFGLYVAKKAIQNHCTAVVMFDYTAYDCFKYLKQNAPKIIRVLDMSSIPAKDIDEIISNQEQKGNGRFFINNRNRYQKKYCELSEKEIEYANYFICPSSFVKKKLLTRKTIRESNIIKADYGIDLSAFRYVERDFSSGVFEIVFVGRIEGPKGILGLLNVCEKMYSGGMDFRLHLIGPNNIEKTILDKPYIVFHGFQNRSRLIELLSGMHLFVLPSLWEGKSQSTLEAIATGLPVAVSESCGVDEIVTENQLGFVFKDEEELYDILDRVFENRAILKDISMNCRLCKNEMSWDNYNMQIQNGFNYVYGEEE